MTYLDYSWTFYSVLEYLSTVLAVQMLTLQFMLTLVALATKIPLVGTECNTMCQGTTHSYTRDKLISLASHVKKDEHLPQHVYSKLKENKLTLHPPTRRGTKGGKYVQRPIKVLISNRPYVKHKQHVSGVNLQNLARIPPIQNSGKHEARLLDICMLNTRSVRNKAIQVKDYIVDKHCDIAALTETWLTSKDDKVVGDVRPKGFTLPHRPREKRRGGGVGLLHNK